MSTSINEKSATETSQEYKGNLLLEINESLGDQKTQAAEDSIGSLQNDEGVQYVKGHPIIQNGDSSTRAISFTANLMLLTR